MTEVIFEATDQNLETGLRGYPVGYCVTSSVDSEKGLFYGNYPISKMVGWDPVSVIYLLYKGKKGTDEEVKQLGHELEKRATISQELIEAIQSLPRNMSPMHMLSCALLFAEGFQGKEDYQEDCLNLIATIPQICASIINHHAGWEGGQPDPHLGYMQNFAQMVGVPGVDKQMLAQVFESFNILHYDHGGGNLSAFVGKAVASGLEDLYGSLSSAMCALAGPRHGRANQDCLNFVTEVLSELGEDPKEEEVVALVERRLANKQLLYGFGHAVLRVEDPRATILYQMASDLKPEDPLVKTALLLRKVVPKVLGKKSKISNPYPNVDAISGTLLTAVGFSYPQYYTLLFGLSRCVGIAIQIVYERTEARGGKGTPIVRPKYFYQPRGELVSSP